MSHLNSDLFCGSSDGQPSEIDIAPGSFYVPNIESHLIHSACVGQVYRIQVMQPVMRRGGDERFPVLYITDANISFDFAKAISHALQITGQVRRYILVGIGYPGENPFVGDILRLRDFTSPQRPQLQGKPTTSLIDEVTEIEHGKKSWGGAAEFMAFIHRELSPFIDQLYPTVVGDRAYAGHSLGGGFGLHALFTQPDLFNRYIIVSPSLSYDDDDYGIREAQKFIASRERLDAQVFMAVGGEEEFDPRIANRRFCSCYFRLGALIYGADIPGLVLSCRIFPGETHVSVWPIAFSCGVQATFGPADGPPLGASNWLSFRDAAASTADGDLPVGRKS